MTEIAEQHSSPSSPFFRLFLLLLAWVQTVLDVVDAWSCLATLGVIFVGALYCLHIVGLCYGKHRLHHPARLDSSTLPGVSIIKPIVGTDDNLSENLESLFTSRHPQLELLFCFESSDEPGIEVVQTLMEKFPNVDSKVFIGGIKVGLNPKVNNMAAAYAVAKYPLVAINDSGIYMRPDAISDMAATIMQDDKMALVTQIPFCEDRTGFAAAFEHVYFGTSHARIYLAGNCLRFNCPTGMSSMFRKEVLDQCGGFEAIGEYLAEDYFIGKKMAELGYKSGISAHPALQNASSATFNAFFNRVGRWFKLRLSMMPQIVLVEPFQDCFPSGTIITYSLHYLFGIHLVPIFTLHVIFWITVDFIVLNIMQHSGVHRVVDPPRTFIPHYFCESGYGLRYQMEEQSDYC
ncbi:hypothetical protein GCK72_022423 [Caenorhabditis remanei]|uniref:ceramide glucosyltransferase n=1 Tax=Caenorhabditis remanei TaxID=31234 RepID=A0A6A5FTU5_CAERE|nr:hypothetical protein GCK72_022423 [Caenorhabditis remanei]KAF1745973.1 hypothetical protein GCK72_022423 [Caenorhabditis remanei]